MIFDDNEIVYNVDRNIIDDWCKRYLIGYIPLSDLNLYLKTQSSSFLRNPTALMGYEKEGKHRRFKQVYTATFLDKNNRLVSAEHNGFITILTITDKIPSFIEFKNFNKSNVRYYEKICSLYDIKVSTQIHMQSSKKYEIKSKIKEEYECI